MDTQGSLGDILNSLMQNPEIMKTVHSFAKGGITVGASSISI